jgi:hypothetical protein
MFYTPPHVAGHDRTGFLIKLDVQGKPLHIFSELLRSLSGPFSEAGQAGEKL